MESTRLMILLLVTVALRGSQSEITEHPQSKVSLPGDYALFWCKGQGSSHLNIDNTVADNVVAYFASRGITWQSTSSGCSGVSQWIVTVLASIRNNGTMLKCIFDDSDCWGGETNTAKLIVVTGPPGPLVAPSVTVTNLTALTLTWTAPWPHPVTNYTVTMLNLTTNQITQWTTTEKRYVLTNEQGGGQCDELVFTVEAETDVGSTGPSTNTTGGFPKGLKDENTTAVKLVITDEDLIITITNPPKVCYYEAEMSYTYTIRRNGSELPLGNWSTHATNLTVSTNNESLFSEASLYIVTIVARNTAGQTLSMESTLELSGDAVADETLPSSLLPTATTTTDIETTTADIETTTAETITAGIETITAGIETITAGIETITADTDPTPVTTPSVTTTLLQDYYVVVLVFGVILIVLLSGVALLFLLLFIVRKKGQLTIRVSPKLKNTKFNGPGIPTNMTTNPLYEESTIYDHVGSMRSLDMGNGEVLPPPQVPPPRKGSVTKRGTMSISLGKSASSSDISSPPLTPRYTETPSCIVGDRRSFQLY